MPNRSQAYPDILSFYIDDMTPTTSVAAESEAQAEDSLSVRESSRKDKDCVSTEIGTAQSRDAKRAGRAIPQY